MGVLLVWGPSPKHALHVALFGAGRLRAAPVGASDTGPSPRAAATVARCCLVDCGGCSHRAEAEA